MHTIAVTLRWKTRLATNSAQRVSMLRPGFEVSDVTASASVVRLHRPYRILIRSS